MRSPPLSMCILCDKFHFHFSSSSSKCTWTNHRALSLLQYSAHHSIITFTFYISYIFSVAATAKTRNALEQPANHQRRVSRRGPRYLLENGDKTRHSFHPHNYHDKNHKMMVTIIIKWQSSWFQSFLSSDLGSLRHWVPCSCHCLHTDGRIRNHVQKYVRYHYHEQYQYHYHNLQMCEITLSYYHYWHCQHLPQIRSLVVEREIRSNIQHTPNANQVMNLTRIYCGLFC